MANREYNRVPYDSISADSSIIDFDNYTRRNNEINNEMHNNEMPNNEINNNFEDDDDIPLLANEYNNSRNRNRYSRIPNNTQSIIISPVYKNYIVNKLYWNICLIIIMSIIGLMLTCFSYVETSSLKGIDIYNIDVEYLYYYFYVLILFYAFYIGILTIILVIRFCKSLDIKYFEFPIMGVNIFFQIHFILRVLVISILIIRMIDDTPLTIINVNNTNIITTANIPVYLPKHIQYMIIETIIYIYTSHLSGISMGVLTILTGY
jgi:hypothetical protein